MPDRAPAISGYKSVWLFAMFDLPVEKKEQRREYSRFRKKLLREGFSMLQYSVYARWYESEETCETCKRFVRANLPPEGQVRLLSVTDRQFEKMEIYLGISREPAEEPPMQVMLF